MDINVRVHGTIETKARKWEEDGIPFAAKIWWIGSVVGVAIKVNLSGKLVRQAISNK